MSEYCTYFKESETLADCIPMGPKSGLSRIAYPALSSDNAAHNVINNPV